MIFVGDIALPNKDAIKLEGMPSELLSKQWIGNLEGSLVKDGDPAQLGLYNDQHAIQSLLKDLPFCGFTLANNHILDLGRSKLQDTIEYLESKNIGHCGAHENSTKAAQPLIIKEKGGVMVILNFGWSVIQCELASSNRPGVNPLTRENVLVTVNEAIQQYTNAAIIPVMHWNYELEAEPQPFERELAKELIDLGVAGVIGAHAHRVGGVEVYKGKPIIYSLGNWMFKQNHFKNGRVRFPEFCNLELAFEWDLESGEMKFHFFQFDPKTSVLSYSQTEELGGKRLDSLTPFTNLSDKAYKGWYKKNHYHKNKGLPVYYWSDSAISISIKNYINLARDFAVNIVQKIKS